MHAAPDEIPVAEGPLAAKVVWSEVPRRDGNGLCRCWIENASGRIWEAGSVVLAVRFNGKPAQRVALRHDVHPGERTHFAFELKPPRKKGDHALELCLAAGRKLEDRTVLSRSTFTRKKGGFFWKR
jgi:hypothetical protein